MTGEPLMLPSHQLATLLPQAQVQAMNFVSPLDDLLPYWRLNSLGAGYSGGPVACTFGYPGNLMRPGVTYRDVALFSFDGADWNQIAATVDPRHHTIHATLPALPAIVAIGAGSGGSIGGISLDGGTLQVGSASQWQVSGLPGALWAFCFSDAGGYLLGLEPIPVLLNSNALVVASGVMPPAGSSLIGLVIPQDPRFRGFEAFFQALAITPAGGIIGGPLMRRTVQ